MVSPNFTFAFGFIFGSIFNLIVIYVIQRLFFPKAKETIPKMFLKELEKIKNQKEKQFQDLSLTIQNLHVNPQKEKKTENVFLTETPKHEKGN